jgi:hypothetical protein
MRQIGFIINRDEGAVMARATLEGDQLMKLSIKCKAKDIDRTMKILTLMKCA